MDLRIECNCPEVKGYTSIVGVLVSSLITYVHTLVTQVYFLGPANIAVCVYSVVHSSVRSSVNVHVPAFVKDERLAVS